MKKNVSGQAIGAQMITASDGSAFTGSVTVSVTGDAGTQATGSVGSGACTHKGNGYHTYAPAQAETNYDLIAFTFTGTGAIPVTVQVYTTFPQTGDVANGVNVTSISGDPTAADNLEADYDGTGYSKSNSTIGTCTTNTDMRGTDSAYTGTPPTAANIRAEIDSNSTELAAIKGRLPASLSNGAIDANIERVNDTAITGDGSSGTEWGPA